VELRKPGTKSKTTRLLEQHGTIGMNGSPGLRRNPLDNNQRVKVELTVGNHLGIIGKFQILSCGRTNPYPILAP